MASTPSTFSRLVGVPVIHSAHAGEFKASMPMMPGAPYESYYLGETQIVDRTGVILARMTREEGEGVITAEISLGRVTPTLSFTTSFWIPKIPTLFRLVWTYQNAHGSRYYRKAKRCGKMFIP
jgi:hypothetical protein